MERPVVHPIRLDDEVASVTRKTYCLEPSLRVGALIEVEIDGRYQTCEIVGKEQWGVHVRRVE